MATRSHAFVAGIRKERGRKFGRAPRASCAPEIPFPFPFEHLQRRLRAPGGARQKRSPLLLLLVALRPARVPTHHLCRKKWDGTQATTFGGSLLWRDRFFPGLANNREMISSLLGNRWNRSTTVITCDKVGYTYRAAGTNTVALLNSFCPLV